jgi:hypothetical protein
VHFGWNSDTDDHADDHADYNAAAHHALRDGGRRGAHLDQLHQRGRDSRNLNRVERDRSNHVSDPRLHCLGR